jgi:hypothetical protein
VQLVKVGPTKRWLYIAPPLRPAELLRKAQLISLGLPLLVLIAPPSYSAVL